MLETHKWRKQTHRTGIATSHQRTHHTSKEGKAYTVCRVQEPQQSEYHARGEMYEHVRTKLLPDWSVPGELFGVTLNRNTVCKQHRDKKNLGESANITAGTKFSVIAHNNTMRPLVYPCNKGQDQEEEEDVAQDGEARAGQHRQEA